MKSAAVTGRDMIGLADNLPVRAFRERLMGGLGLENGGGRKALDLGCGDGLISGWLAERGWKVTGIDAVAHPAWKGLSKAARGRLSFKVADAKRWAKLGKAWDLVLSKDVLHHLPDPAKALKDMRSMVKPGGQVMVIEANRLNPIMYVHLTLFGEHDHFTRGKLNGLLDGAGLKPRKFWVREARVWPLGLQGFQTLMNKVQDVLEWLPGWGLIVCYHIALYTRGRKRDR